MWSEVNHSSSASEMLRMSGAVTPLPHYAFTVCIVTTLLYHTLYIERTMTPLPLINSTPWALDVPCATIFNVLCNEVITLPQAISGRL
jgi:hypothetical protein